MNDEKKYVDDDGVEWKRVWSLPQLSTEASIDPWDNADFVNKTANTKGTLGDMMDRSQELSQKRADQNGGVDPVKEKYYENYSKQRGGAVHQDKDTKTFENKHIKIDL
ncbi:MAG: hypothetical protein HN786_05135 [Cellvibrionales bacterium]|nr:hypothetical protein [Cellvibrionales bacterium]